MIIKFTRESKHEFVREFFPINIDMIISFNNDFFKVDNEKDIPCLAIHTNGNVFYTTDFTSEGFEQYLETLGYTFHQRVI